jgi:hypothetical protein
LNPLRSEFLKQMKYSDSECSENSASFYESKIKGLQAMLQQKTWNVAFPALF